MLKTPKLKSCTYFIYEYREQSKNKRIKRLGFRSPNIFFLTKENKTIKTTGPSARKAEMSSFTVPDLDLSNDSHLAHGVTGCQSIAKISFPSYSKNTGEKATAFVHCHFKEDTLMLILNAF